jgi:hypothetical protein
MGLRAEESIGQGFGEIGIYLAVEVVFFKIVLRRARKPVS